MNVDRQAYDGRQKAPFFLRIGIWSLTYISCRAKYFIAAPNLLRVGVEETVSISVFDVDGDVDIELSLHVEYPKRRTTFSQVSGKFGKRMRFFPWNLL